MNPQEALTRRKLFEIVLERASQTAAGVLILTSCAPQASSLPVSAIDSKPSQNPKPQKSEAPLEPGWKRFHSLNYPYYMDYRDSWSAQSTQVSGKKKDIFLGETIDDYQVNVGVSSEPVESWVRIEDYVDNFMSQLEPLAVYGKESISLWNKDSDRNSVSGLDKSKFDYRNTVIYNLAMTDVEKNRTYMVDANLTNPILSLAGRYVATSNALFIANGKAWTMTLAVSTRRGNEPAILPPMETFTKMLGSFRFL